MEYLAHSGSKSSPPQTYAAHVRGVYSRANRYVEEMEPYAVLDSGQLKAIISSSSLLHDLGKLDDQNQAVLHKPLELNRHLPVNHVDAGTAALKMSNHLFAALAVYSHHKGLPDMAAEAARTEEAFLRDERPSMRRTVEAELSLLLDRHHEHFEKEQDVAESQYPGDKTVFLRLMLSIIADADHTDTAAAYGQAPIDKIIPALKAQERLEALDKYVATLGGNDLRSRLRKEMYFACRDANIKDGFAICDSPVGSGKTTAVMAHLLKQAVKRKARRIFVVLPYTSIIQQSVEIYRKVLTLPGENPEDVVAELHYRADFQNPDTRYLTSLWRAPIIVTTAVAFFETLASNRPSVLRKFHELPGSVIFIDEAHNALPITLLPLAWRWIHILADEWSCYWVLASGSLVKYWQLSSLQQVQMPRFPIPQLVESDLRNRLLQYEDGRVSFCYNKETINRHELIQWVQSFPGPRLLILNTVQSTAVIANDFKKVYGRQYVEHLSTALTPEDRDNTIRKIKDRLKDKNDNNWTLVATSCVEAGVDFSFRTGFREISSLLSLLQAAGRVNRNGVFKHAEMWSFRLQVNSMLKRNPAVEVSSKVLKNFLDKDILITPELSTKSMNEEIINDDSCLNKIEHFMILEDNMQFSTIEKEYKVINTETVCAIVDPALAKLVTIGKGNWRALQRKSVSINKYNLQRWSLKEIAQNVYQWTIGYDSFLGYMSGVLQIESNKNDSLII